jgi:succinate dehydrogenase / fumarate reductase cytochrome b subunit
VREQATGSVQPRPVPAWATYVDALAIPSEGRSSTPTGQASVLDLRRILPPMAQTTQTIQRPPRVNPIRKPKRRLPFPFSLYQSAVGKKWVMALSGIALLGYVLVHMIGNLHIYEGPEQINSYGEALRDLGGNLLPRTLGLWILRVLLISAFVLHIHSAYGLTRMNQAANARYASKRDYVAANFASRMMRWTGVIILLFLFFHLADLTWGWWLGDDYVRGDVYHNVTSSLSSVPVAIIYIVANIALAVHIYHGAWSMFQSIGANNPTLNKIRRPFAAAFATVILVGNLSFPIAAVTGFVNEDNRTTPPPSQIEAVGTVTTEVPR